MGAVSVNIPSAPRYLWIEWLSYTVQGDKEKQACEAHWLLYCVSIEYEVLFNPLLTHLLLAVLRHLAVLGAGGQTGWSDLCAGSWHSLRRLSWWLVEWSLQSITKEPQEPRWLHPCGLVACLEPVRYYLGWARWDHCFQAGDVAHGSCLLEQAVPECRAPSAHGAASRGWYPWEHMNSSEICFYFTWQPRPWQAAWTLEFTWPHPPQSSDSSRC